jgi:hypothetical protein
MTHRHREQARSHIGFVLSAFDQAYRKHIARRAVQHVIGGGAQ